MLQKRAGAIVPARFLSGQYSADFEASPLDDRTSGRTSVPMSGVFRLRPKAAQPRPPFVTFPRAVWDRLQPAMALPLRC